MRERERERERERDGKFNDKLFCHVAKREVDKKRRGARERKRAAHE